MSFWINPLWFGRSAVVETGTRPRLLFEGDGAMPVHTKCIEVLQEEMPNINVWPDIDMNEDRSDRIVVENAGGDWDNSFHTQQRRSRTLEIWAISSTSDGAERLLDKVTFIIRKIRRELRLMSVNDLKGGYSREAELFLRGVSATFHGR